MKKENIGLLQIILASLLFGFIPIVVRIGTEINPYSLAFFRVVVSAFSLALFFLFYRKNFVPFKYEKGKLFLFGAIHGFIILGYFIAIQFLTVALAVLLLYSSSIWMIIFSHFILHEKITKRTVLAITIAFIGVILVLYSQNMFIGNQLIGLICGLLAGVGFGLVYVLSKTFKKYDKISLTFWQNIIALPFLLPSIFISLPNFTFNNVLLIILLGTLFTTIPFILVFKGFQKVKGQKGAIAVLLDIIFPIAFAYFIFQEIPSLTTFIGGILVLIGVFLSTKE